MKTVAACAMFMGAAVLFGLQGKAMAEPMKPPAEVVQVQPQAVLSGRSTLRVLGLAIYDARLWVSRDFALPSYVQHPFALELQYQRSLKGRLIAQRSLAEMRRQRDFPEPQATTWGEQMQALFPDVGPGDRITGEYLPGSGARFWFNGRLLGEVRDAQFAKLFFGIWLSPETSEPQARCALAACS
ncbi:chalcone isomerase family protein [Curvibacter sp. APW13]|uniref:chalcone isomerase family protein n=1 Tax=Curvibacter sp. APW13 TaxID=3077236 RepID=UPI0028DE8105|nr:chalcone isomerase family protein [Curvibacter sp. APW13]MDT8990417.1 chalcone isomerase family protein [Curvibacter sp. APW13]